MEEPGSETGLPVIKTAANMFKIPIRTPERALEGLRGLERAFVQAELAMLRCQFKRVRELCLIIGKSPRHAAMAIRYGVVAAIGLGDFDLFDRSIGRIEEIRRNGRQPMGRLGAEIIESWVRQWLWISTGHPTWMVRLELDGIPEEWSQISAYLGIRIRLMRGQYEAANVASALAMNFVRRNEKFSPFRLNLWLTRAIACRELGRTDDMQEILRMMVGEAGPVGFLLPFLTFLYGTAKSPVEMLLGEIAPQELQRFRELSRTFIPNLIRMRNHYTGEHLVSDLSPRELFIARSLANGVSYKDLAVRCGLSVGRARNLVSVIYEKLNVHSSRELEGRVICR